MTFILGINCSDGVVLCADTLEGDTITRRYRNKLESVHVSDEWGICWGGSGTAAVVDKFSDKLKGSLGNDSFNRQQIEEKIETCLEFIHQYYPRDPISIVVGLFGKPLIKPKNKQPYLGHYEIHLYRGHSSSACIAPEREYAVAGMDVTLASFTLSNTYHSLIHLEEGKNLGIFVTALMKKYADGVGGDTHVVFGGSFCNFWLQMAQDKVNAVERDYSVEDADTSMSAYWAARNPESYSAMKHREKITTLKRKLRRSGARKSKGQQ
jgi:hypothetical protein